MEPLLMAADHLTQKELKSFLDEKVDRYNRSTFIENDPISIPHGYSLKEDIEIAAFFAAIFSWGQRKTIVSKSRFLMEGMGNSPFNFVMNHSKSDLKKFENFRHRTFNFTDLKFYVLALKRIYAKGGLEKAFSILPGEKDMKSAILRCRKQFLEVSHEKRSEKHLSNPAGGSAAKRLNMFLRWMVRKDQRGVDLGIWKSIPSSVLSIPLDVHSGRVSRELGLLKRSQNDWLAVEELDKALRLLDPADPAKYDFALFGLGVSGELSLNPAPFSNPFTVK